MSLESDLILFILSAVLYVFVGGAHAAVQVVSYARTDRDGEDVAERRRFIDRFFDSAIPNYFALSSAHVLALAFLMVAAYRFGALRLFATSGLSPGLLTFVFVSMFFVVLLAKVFALRDPERFIDVSRFVTSPLIYVLRPAAVAGIAAMGRVTPRLVDALAFPVLPLKKRIELFGYRNGEEDIDEQALVSSVFEFGDRKVREVMVPRIDMVAVNVHMNPSEAVDEIVETGHSRVPVFDESVDRIVGVVHTQDLLQRIVRGDEILLSDVMRDVYFVPESKKIDDLLSEFQQRKIHLAIVVDEYGGTAGLITLEDVLEELVGDIQDEFDSEEELVKKLDDDTAVCSARVRLDELNELLGIGLPEGDVDTLGGFLYESIGRVPRVGEFVRNHGIEFRVQSVVRQRIDKVLIKGIRSLDQDVENGAG